MLLDIKFLMRFQFTETAMYEGILIRRNVTSLTPGETYTFNIVGNVRGVSGPPSATNATTGKR